MSYQSFYGREKGIETTTPNFKGTIIEKPMTYAEKLYEHMLTVVNSGGCLPIKDESGEVKIFFKGMDGEIKQTEWESSLENAKNSEETEDCYDKPVFVSYTGLDNWQPLTPFRIPTEPLPVGTKVRVNENAEEECISEGINWHTGMRRIIGETLTVTGSWKHKVKCSGWVLPLSAVTPVFEHEEVTDEQAAINLLKKHGYKIIKE